MITSGLVNVFTHDIVRALAFYQGVLGLPETFRTPKAGVPDHVELKASEFVVALSTAEAARRAHGLDAEVGCPAMSLVFWVDDVDAVFNEVAACGAPVVTRPHDTGNNKSQCGGARPGGHPCRTGLQAVVMTVPVRGASAAAPSACAQREPRDVGALASRFAELIHPRDRVAVRSSVESPCGQLVLVDPRRKGGE